MLKIEEMNPATAVTATTTIIATPNISLNQKRAKTSTTLFQSVGAAFIGIEDKVIYVSISSDLHLSN